MTARRLRRFAAVVILLVQAALVVRAYAAPVDVFGFQMFPESSDWSVRVFRVTSDGGRVDVGDPWPGGYRWSDLVAGSGLEGPSGRHPADYGTEASLHFLQGALDWVAGHTPLDTLTVRLLAEVDLWPNGRGPDHLVLTSVTR